MTQSQTPGTDRGQHGQPRHGQPPRPRAPGGAQRRPPSSHRPARRRRSGIGGFLIWTVVTIVMLVVAAGTFLVIAAPTDLVRDRLIQEVRERTGRDLHVAGDTSLRFFPDIGISMARVSLSPPPGMSSDPTVRVAAIDAKVPLFSLLRGEMRIDRVVLRSPEINLHVDRTGRRSWDFADAATMPTLPRPIYAQMPGIAGKAAAQRLWLDSIQIEGGTVRYRDDRRAVEETISDLDLTLALPGPDAPITANGKGIWRRERVALEAALASPEDLRRGGVAPLQVRVAGKPIDAGFTGTLDIATANLAGDLTLKADSMRALAAWLGKPMTSGDGRGPLSLTGRLRHSTESSELSNADILIDGTALRGAIAVDQWSGPRPRLRGDLHMAELNLNRLLAMGEAGSNARDTPRRMPRSKAQVPANSIDDLLKRDESEPSTPALRPQVRGFFARHGWSETPFNLAALALADGTLKLSTDRVLYRDVISGPARISATLENRVLQANIEDIALYEGRGRGVVIVNAAHPDPTLQLSMLFEEVSALGLLKDASDFDWIAGKGRISLAVAGRGKSERLLVETLNGEAQFHLRDGALVGYDIPQTIRGLQQGRIPGFDRNMDQRTPFSEASATFKITNGVAENRDLRLISPLMQVSGTGSANLPSRTLDYTLRPKLVSTGQGGPQLSGFELPVRITGSWDRPNVQPVLDGVLKDPDKAVETVKELGRQFKGKDVNEIVRGLVGEDGKIDKETRQKARDLFRQLVKPDR